MKQTLALLLAMLLCLSLCFGCNSYIGKNKAKEIALADAGVAEKDIRDYDCELDKERGTAVYELDFEVGFDEYEYDIDAVTGEILKSKID